MSFRQQVGAFFDELGKIQQQQQQARDTYMSETRGDSAGPYSNLLTQDETPTDYRPSVFPEPNDPEVILRGLP